jgi:hypothetical protein
MTDYYTATTLGFCLYMAIHEYARGRLLWSLWFCLAIGAHIALT